MQHSPIVGSPAHWARDFAIVGAVTGSLAPFFVIFDPTFAIAGGVAGGLSGLAVGAGLATAVEAGRSWIPMSVMAAMAALVGAVWGAGTGGIAGGVSAVVGSQFDEGVVALGFVFGGLAGMLQLGWMFLPYLMGAMYRRTWPVVGLALVAAPAMGWGSFFALIASSLGLWLFILPMLVVGALFLEGSVARARALERPSALDRLRALNAGIAGEAAGDWSGGVARPMRRAAWVPEG